MKIYKLLKNDLWDAIINYCLYAAVFLMPILFFPWTNYQVAWNKQFVLATLIFVAFIAWLIKSITKGEIVFARTILNYFLKGLILVAIISAILMPAHSLGFFGATGAEVDTVLALLIFSLTFFLIVNSTVSDRIIAHLFIISSAIVALMSLLQLVGWGILPWSFAQSTVFNTIGTTNALSIFLGFVFVMLFAALYWRHTIAEGKVTRGSMILMALAVVLLCMVALIRFWVPFVGIALGTLVVLWHSLTKGHNRSGKLIVIPLVILAFSAFFITANFVPSLNVRFVPSFSLPLEVTPSFSASWSIAQTTLQENWRSFLFGSGPASFQYQYGAYHQASLNASDFWSVRFVQGINALLTQLVNLGVAGMALWLAFLLFLMGEVARALAHRRRPIMSLGLGYLIVMLFLYPQNSVLYFFVFVLAGLLLRDHYAERHIAITSTPFKTFAFSLGLMAVILFSASFIFVEAERYVGSLYFYSGLQSFSRDGNVDTALPKLLTATDYDPRSDLYLQNIAQGYLLKVNAIVTTTVDNQAGLQQLQADFSRNLGGAIEAAQRATVVNPLDSQNWLLLGQVYESVALLVPGAAEKAIEVYMKAATLEPNNPAIATAVGRAQLAAGDFTNRTDKTAARVRYGEAVTSLEKAIALKDDYIPAHFVLAQTYDRQGRDRQVAMESNGISQLANGDPAIFYQLGLFHYRANRLSQAQTYLEAAVQLFDNYSNARYFLGLAYASTGERAKAIEQFSKIQELNPNNAEIKDILRQLRSGGGAAVKNVKEPALESQPAPKKSATEVAQ